MDVIPVGNLLRPNQQIEFGAGRADIRFGPGWSTVEDEFRWTEGAFAEFTFAVTPDSDASRLAIDCEPKLQDGNPGQVLIFNNGRLVVAREMTGRAMVEVPVARNEATNKLVIWVPDAIHPANPTAAHPDHRKLGLCVYSIMLK